MPKGWTPGPGPYPRPSEGPAVSQLLLSLWRTHAQQSTPGGDDSPRTDALLLPSERRRHVHQPSKDGDASPTAAGHLFSETRSGWQYGASDSCRAHGSHTDLAADTSAFSNVDPGLSTREDFGLRMKADQGSAVADVDC